MTRRRHQRRKSPPFISREAAPSQPATVFLTRSEDPFTPVVIDNFRRAQQLYGATFESWEDFDPEAR
jgi:hypothetical protein